MGNIEYIITTKSDIELLMKIRLEMLKEVNNLAESYEFDKSFIDKSRNYFEEGNQTTVLAFDGEEIVGCASISYIWIMPTFSHPTGNRAHLMNVYTKSNYRRRGIAKKMVEILINDARENGATEISLDATEKGRPLYESLGFVTTDTGMYIQVEKG